MSEYSKLDTYTYTTELDSFENFNITLYLLQAQY